MAQPSANPFGGTTANPFGAAAATQPTSNIFAAAPTQTPNPFGAPGAPASSFGAPAQAVNNPWAASVQTANNSFGAPSQTANNAFAAPAQPVNNGFGATSQAQNTAFSKPSTAGIGGQFGAPSTQLSGFGAPSAPAPPSQPSSNPFGKPSTLQSNQNAFGQAPQKPSPFQKPTTSGGAKTDTKKKVTFGGKKEIPNGPKVNEPRPNQDRKKLGNGHPDREPSERTKQLSPFAYEYAIKLKEQLQKDKIRPPQWLPDAGNPAKKGAVETLKEAYKKYRTRVYASLRKADLIDDPDKRRRLEDALAFKGVCEDMCPEFEQIARIAEFDVKMEEKIKGADGLSMWAETSRMVKKFGRSAAGQDAPLPMDVRSVDALRRTTDYLFKDLLQTDNNLPSMHNFLWDRTRAVRKDFTFHSQKSKGEMEVLVYVFETITRFHATSLHLLSRKGYANDDFDQKQEIEQLGRTILSLIEAYDKCKEMKVHCPNEAEFRAYYILLNYHDSSIRMRSLVKQNGEAWFENKDIQTALALIEAMDDLRDDKGPLKPRRRVQMSDSGCGKYFQIVQDPSVSYTMACIAAVHFTYVRQNMLRVLTKSYARHRDAPRTITASILNEFLRFDTAEEAVEFAELHGFEFTSEYPAGKKAPPEPYLLLNQKSKYVPSPRVKHAYSGELVERKRGSHSLTHVIYNTVYEDPKPQELPSSNKSDQDDELFVRQTKDHVLPSSPSTANSQSTKFLSSSPSVSPAPSPPREVKPTVGTPSLVASQGQAATTAPSFSAPALNGFSTGNPGATGSIFAPNPQPTPNQPSTIKPAPIFGSTTGTSQSAPTPTQSPAPKLGSIFGHSSSAPRPAPIPPSQPSLFNPPVSLSSPGLSAPSPTVGEPQKPGSSLTSSTFLGGNDTPKVSFFFPAAPKDNAAPKPAVPSGFGLAAPAVPTTTTGSSLAPPAAFPAPKPQPAAEATLPSAAPVAKLTPPQQPQPPATLGKQLPSSNPTAPAPFQPGLGASGLAAPQLSSALQTAPAKPEAPKPDPMGNLTKWYVAAEGGLLTEFTEALVENLVSTVFANWQQEEAEKKRKEEDERSWEEARKHQRWNLSVKYFYRWRETVRKLATKRILREGKEKMKAYRERERLLAKQKKEEEEKAAHAARKAAKRQIEADGARLGMLASQRMSATEQELLASGIFSGLRDERGAARRAAADGTDWQVATFSPDYAESELELEPPRRSIMAAVASTTGSPDSIEKKEGWKTKSLREKFGVEPRRSLSASSSFNGSIAKFRQSLPAFRATNFSRKRTASESSDGVDRDAKRKTTGSKLSNFKSRHWELRARGLVPLPNGEWVPEAIAQSRKAEINGHSNSLDDEQEAVRDDESIGSHSHESNADAVTRIRERLARLRKSEGHRLSHHSVGGYEAGSPSPQTGSNRAIFSASPAGSRNSSFSNKRKRDSEEDDDGSQAGSSPTSAKRSFNGKRSETGAMVEDVRKMLRELHETMDQWDQDAPVVREQLEMSMLGGQN
ncbi:SAC3/GANP/Nin1/mts3/eIF-3 p25 family-domain-containing protein [Rhypophila decipiens]|uniref:SAC3/GANP/Nin1/mts3/eIF-3 p25 family-domain-containing protein n=1 Tax=Rhypophila decipiens TaxID=261697 RepID=A0AAN6Y382_9PEZI|nr:SAC3/GANP/Nin1/mts3/eIF-3 p25 family-domain-containing protein [Rhypophila decipiens]